MPRERFVPDAYRAVAFADAPIPIGHGEWMLTPALEGRILQALAPVRGERVLEIGTGSGYFAACLAHLTGSVDSIEIHAELAAGAARALGDQGIARMSIETGDALARDFEAAVQDRRSHGIPARPGSARSSAPWWSAGACSSRSAPGPRWKPACVTRTGEDSWLSEPLFETRIAPLILKAAPSRFIF